MASAQVEKLNQAIINVEVSLDDPIEFYFEKEESTPMAWVKKTRNAMCGVLLYCMYVMYWSRNYFCLCLQKVYIWDLKL